MSGRVADGAGAGLAASVAELVGLRVEARRLGLGLGGGRLATRAGGHLSRFRGPGVEYDESRAYVPGDDPRAMDWRVTARAVVPHVKVYREERERPVWLVVDQGPSMRFGTRVALKSVVAARAAALLGWAAVGHGDRVGGIVYAGDRRLVQPPAGRERGLLPLLRALATAAPPAAIEDRGAERAGLGPARLHPDHRAHPHPDHAARIRPDHPAPLQLDHPARRPDPLADALARVLPRLRPGSLVCVVSDFAGLTADADWLSRLAAHAEVLLVFVYDPIEAEAPPPGIWPVTDGWRVLPLDLRTPARRDLYRQRFTRHRDALLALARRHGAHCIGLATDQAVGPTLGDGLRARIGKAW